jgi:hypothetical protein
MRSFVVDTLRAFALILFVIGAVTLSGCPDASNATADQWNAMTRQEQIDLRGDCAFVAGEDAPNGNNVWEACMDPAASCSLGDLTVTGLTCTEYTNNGQYDGKDTYSACACD